MSDDVQTQVKELTALRDAARAEYNEACDHENRTLEMLRELDEKLKELTLMTGGLKKYDVEQRNPYVRYFSYTVYAQDEAEALTLVKWHNGHCDCPITGINSAYERIEYDDDYEEDSTWEVKESTDDEPEEADEEA